MTLPRQRAMAISRARAFLTRISSPYVQNGLKGIRSEVRAEARDILRHFPFDDDEELPVMVDPASGWKYGFPKLWDRKTNLRDWLVANGYPQHLADEGLPVRFIGNE